MALDLTLAVHLANRHPTVGDAMTRYRGERFGPWSLNGSASTLNLYAANETMPARSPRCDDSCNPTRRN